MSSDKIVNGVAYDWGCMTIKVDGQDYEGLFKEISYNAKRTRGKQMGTSPKVRRYTRGTIEFDGSMTWYREGLDAYIDKQGPGWMEKKVTIAVSYGNAGQPIRTDTLDGVDFNSDENSGKEGADSVEVKTALNILDIKKNGVSYLTEQTA
jgi:hypothetical protein